MGSDSDATAKIYEWLGQAQFAWHRPGQAADEQKDDGRHNIFEG